MTEAARARLVELQTKIDVELTRQERALRQAFDSIESLKGAEITTAERARLWRGIETELGIQWGKHRSEFICDLLKMWWSAARQIQLEPC